MAFKAAIKLPNSEKDRVLVKYVKKAKMWVKTTFFNGKQTQEWFTEKPKED